jgi:hypothetical protein
LVDLKHPKTLARVKLVESCWIQTPLFGSWLRNY